MLSTDSLLNLGKWSEEDQWTVERWCKRRVGRRYNQVKNMISYHEQENQRVELD